MGERRRERTGAEVREREHYPISKESPCWCVAIKTHTNKSLHRFIIMSTDRILSANIFHSHNGSYVSFCHSHSHSTKAITDCSVLSGVWQSFAKGAQRGTVWLVGVLLMLEGGGSMGLELEGEGSWPRINCKYKEFSDSWGWTRIEKLFFGTGDSDPGHMIRGEKWFKTHKKGTQGFWSEANPALPKPHLSLLFYRQRNWGQEEKGFYLGWEW